MNSRDQNMPRGGQSCAEQREQGSGRQAAAPSQDEAASGEPEGGCTVEDVECRAL